jgi:hypothetical protein
MYEDHPLYPDFRGSFFPMLTGNNSSIGTSKTWARTAISTNRTHI